jgi:hypothetical protein
MSAIVYSHAGATEMNMIDYEIVTLEEASSPPTDDLVWFRYVIANDVTAIEGMRAGTREEVFDYACRCAERLNNRQKGPTRW